MSANRYGEAWEEQETSIKWRDDMVFKLIALRQKYNSIFSGKRGSARDGWTTIAAELGLLEHNYKVLQKKWQNLVQKYKEVRSPVNNPNSNSDKPLTTTWVFYNAMDQLLGDPEIAGNTMLIESPRAVRHVVQSSDGDGRHIIDFDFSDLTLDQETSEQPFKRKKVSEGFDQPEQSYNSQSVQYVDSSEPPQWFRDFLATYRQDEAKRMEALKSMHFDIMRLERKKCALLQELISKLSADDDVLSDPDSSPSNVPKSGNAGHPTTTLTVTMDQSEAYKVESATADSQEPDEDSELDVVRAVEVLEDNHVIIKPDQSISASESLVTLSQPSITTKGQLLSTKSMLSSGQNICSPVKVVVAGHAGSMKGGQPLLIKATTSRGKLLVPMRKLLVPASETSSSVCLTSDGTVLTDSVINAQGYQCIDASDSGQ